jgi:hypothetical protein
VTNDIETLITALYVKIDDELCGPRWRGRPPVLTDPGLVCLATAQTLLGVTSGAHWLCGMPASTWPACSRTCRSSRAITSGCGPR